MRRVQTVLWTTLVLLAAACVAYAAESGGAEAHGLPWKDFLFRVINFVLVVAIIWKFAGKQIKDFFKGRQYQIKAELEDLDSRRKQAEIKLKEMEKSISNIEAEKKAILDDYRKQGEAMKASIIAEAERKAVHIKAQAETAVSQEVKLATETLRSQVAEMVVVAAEKMLAEKLSDKKQQQLIDDYVTKVVLN